MVERLVVLALCRIFGFEAVEIGEARLLHHSWRGNLACALQGINQELFIWLRIYQLLRHIAISLFIFFALVASILLLLELATLRFLLI